MSDAIDRLDESMMCPKCGSFNWHIEKEYHEYAVHNIIVCDKCREKYQMSDNEEIRQKLKEKGIKIWSREEIHAEYNKTGQDKNYIHLDLIGKPFFLVSPTYDGLRDIEYVAYEDLKPYIKGV